MGLRPAFGEDEMEGAMQQAPQWGRQSMVGVAGDEVPIVADPGAAVSCVLRHPLRHRSRSLPCRPAPNYPILPPSSAPCANCRPRSRDAAVGERTAFPGVGGVDLLQTGKSPAHRLLQAARASYKIACLLDRGQGQRGVVAASAGNHAQGVARRRRKPGYATVVMPVNAALTKVEAPEPGGPGWSSLGSTLEAAREAAESLAQESGAALIHPYDDWGIIAGQAGVDWKSSNNPPEVGQIVVPWAAGALAGIALAVKSQRPEVRIVGVQADAVAPWRHFLADGGIDPVPAEAHPSPTVSR